MKRHQRLRGFKEVTGGAVGPTRKLVLEAWGLQASSLEAWRLLTDGLVIVDC